MKRGLVCVLLLLTGCGQSGDPKQEIEKKNKQMEEALLKENPSTFSALWASDGLYINLATQKTVKGKGEIQKHFSDFFKTANFSKVQIDRIEFMDENTASEEGKLEVEYAGKPTETHTFKAIFVNQDGTWVIQKVVEKDGG